MKSIELNEEEKNLKDQIEKNLSKLRNYYKSLCSDIPREDARQIISDNANICLQLHKILKKKGHPPIHSKYMIRNRKVLTSESFEFYDHFHPQEDLIKFIEDPEANVRETNPEDTTMGKTFDFSVYSRRWGHNDCYQLKRNVDGWYISFLSHNGQCDCSGNPYLYKNLEHDFISYPLDLHSYISSIWSHAENGESFDVIQCKLKKVANWVSNCERSAPANILI